MEHYSECYSWDIYIFCAFHTFSCLSTSHECMKICSSRMINKYEYYFLTLTTCFLSVRFIENGSVNAILGTGWHPNPIIPNGLRLSVRDSEIQLLVETRRERACTYALRRQLHGLYSVKDISLRICQGPVQLRRRFTFLGILHLRQALPLSSWSRTREARPSEGLQLFRW